MTDLKRLRELAMAAMVVDLGDYVGLPNEKELTLRNACYDFGSACSPTAILALLDRLERYEGALKQVLAYEYRGRMFSIGDQERLRDIARAALEGGGE